MLDIMVRTAESHRVPGTLDLVNRDTPDDNAARLSRLFRHSLNTGQVHPLLRVMQSHTGIGGGASRPPAAAVLPAATRTPSAEIGIDALRQKVVQLPSLPQAVLDVMAVLGNEGASTGDIADRIEHDQALTARTLRIANSSFYGVPGRIGSIRGAIGILGVRAVGTLLTTAAVSAQLPASRCPEFAFGVFWRHAFATALASRELARHLGLDEEIAFTAGLLHDIGRLALATQFPAEVQQVLRYARSADLDPLEAERQVLSVDHIAAGVLIATHWRFPVAVVEAIEHHHSTLTRDTPLVADVVHVADALAHGINPSSCPDEMVPPVDLSRWARLGLTMPQCLATLESASEGVAGVCKALAL